MRRIQKYLTEHVGWQAQSLLPGRRSMSFADHEQVGRGLEQAGWDNEETSPPKAAGGRDHGSAEGTAVAGIIPPHATNSESDVISHQNPVKTCEMLEKNVKSGGDQVRDTENASELTSQVYDVVASSDNLAAAEDSVLAFQPLLCSVDVEFWRTVGYAKLTEWRLDTPLVEIEAELLPIQQSAPTHGGCSSLASASNTSTSWRLHIGPQKLRRASASLPSELSSQGPLCRAEGATGSSAAIAAKDDRVSSLLLTGLFYNVNTASEFRSANRNEVLQSTIEMYIALAKDLREYRERVLFDEGMPEDFREFLEALLFPCSAEDGLLMRSTRIFVLAFSDLKSQVYYYNIAIPALRPLLDFRNAAVARFATTLAPSEVTFLGRALHANLIVTAPSSLPQSTSSANLLRGLHCAGSCLFVRVTLSDDPDVSVPHNSGSSEAAEELLSLMAMYGCASSQKAGALWDRDAPVFSYAVPLGVLFRMKNATLQNMVLQQEYASCSESFSASTIGKVIFADVSSSITRQLPALASARKKRRSGTEKVQIECAIAIVDTTKDAAAMGWVTRNLLFILGYSLQLGGSTLTILSYRDGRSFSPSSADLQGNICSRVFSVRMPPPETFVLPDDDCSAKRVSRDPVLRGWLRAQSKESAPASVASTYTFSVDLRRFLDPVRVQAEAVDLNVRLIQWRILPAFNPAELQDLRFLLLGCGTLGCAIAQTLVAWGVKQFILVDSGRVAMSSPGRQILYSHSDAVTNAGLGTYKVLAARQRLLDIRPDLQVDAEVLDIPMPGYPRYLTRRDEGDSGPLPAEFLQSHDKLQELLGRADVVLLLTDTRESRWLPSLMLAALHHAQAADSEMKLAAAAATSTGESSACSALSPPDSVPSSPATPPSCLSALAAPRQSLPPACVTVALGFESFIVIRHGFGLRQDHFPSSRHLACYFCNDLSAPSDSLSLRMLDQQCTVTRPGLSGFAAGAAVELIAALSQHPLRFHAPHCDSSETSPSCLGACPHAVRGFLDRFQLVSLSSEGFAKCICCGEKVVRAYLERGAAFVAEAVESSALLERISGLADLKEASKEDQIGTFEFDDLELDDVDVSSVNFAGEGKAQRAAKESKRYQSAIGALRSQKKGRAESDELRMATASQSLDGSLQQENDEVLAKQGQFGVLT